MKSSLGFHTMTLALSLRRAEMERLVMDFWRYQEEMQLIEMHIVRSPPGEKTTYPEYRPRYNGERLVLPSTIQVSYSDQRDSGIRWTLNSDYADIDYKEYTVEARVNPKILSGIYDYLTAANVGDVDTVIRRFNAMASDISPILGQFDNYQFRRIDYCVNFDVTELAPGCTPEQIIKLIKRADIPPHYTEWVTYDETAHRLTSKPDSFYLKSKSANINCYRKSVELEERAKKTKGDMHKILLEAALAAKNVIRFEVQCKYPKVYALSRQTGGLDTNYHKYYDLLGYPICLKQINQYYKSTVGAGDWFSLSKARRIIKGHRFNSQKERRLLDTLDEVSRCRSLRMAKVRPPGSILETLKRSVKDLNDIGINPVTIPREWGVDHIPNLLHTFNDMDHARIACPNLPLI